MQKWALNERNLNDGLELLILNSKIWSTELRIGIKYLNRYVNNTTLFSDEALSNVRDPSVFVLCVYYMLDTADSYSRTAQYIRKIVHSSLYSWTMYINKKMLPPYVNFLATGWHITGNSTASFSISAILWRSYFSLSWKIGLFCLLYMTSNN